MQADAHSGVCEIIVHPHRCEASLRHLTPDPHFNVGTAARPCDALGWAIISQPANNLRMTRMGDYFAAGSTPHERRSTLTLGVRGRRREQSSRSRWAIISQTPDPQPDWTWMHRALPQGTIGRGEGGTGDVVACSTVSRNGRHPARSAV